MTKDDFYILRNSITMMQLAQHYGFHIVHKGSSDFIRCPFHGGGSERTPSLKVFPEYRGFHCKACSTGGDVTRFVELYEGVTTKEAALMLSEWFNIPISESAEVPTEVRERANKARKEYEQQIALEEQSKADLKQLNSYITAYRNIIKTEEPFSDLWCFAQNKLFFETYKQMIACEQLNRKHG